MTRSIFLRIVLIVSSALTIIGVLLMNWVLETSDDRDVIKIYLNNDEVVEVVKFESLALIPGDSCEYVVVLSSENSKIYDLNLSFVEIEDKPLKNFAYVKIISGEEVLCDELLATTFEGEGIDLLVDFNEGKNTIIKIVYYLPIDVGNEAKNAEAKFELRLTAKNE